MTWGSPRPFGWVAYAPLSNTVQGSFLLEHMWAQFLIWIALAAVWTVASLFLFRTKKSGPEE